MTECPTAAAAGPRLLMLAAVFALTIVAGPAFAADPPPGGDASAAGAPGAPPPVNTNTHPEALILNVRNPLAVHAGPGKPNVGTVYIPPTLSGKDKTKGKDAGGAPPPTPAK
jgi:hypothetical protein